MGNEHLPRTRYSLTVTDAYDGAIRVLVDAQRFGLLIEDFSLRAGDAAGPRIDMTVAHPTTMDVEQIGRRFGRHGGILHVDCVSTTDGGEI